MNCSKRGLMQPNASLPGVIPQRPLGSFRLPAARCSPEYAIGARHDPRLRIVEVVLILVIRFRLILCAAFGRRFLPRSGLHCQFGLPDLLQTSLAVPQFFRQLVAPLVRLSACPCHDGMVRHLSDQVVAFSQSLDLHLSVVSPEGLRQWKDGCHLLRHGRTSDDS